MVFRLRGAIKTGPIGRARALVCFLCAFIDGLRKSCLGSSAERRRNAWSSNDVCVCARVCVRVCMCNRLRRATGIIKTLSNQDKVIGNQKVVKHSDVVGPVAYIPRYVTACSEAPTLLHHATWTRTGIAVDEAPAAASCSAAPVLLRSICTSVLWSTILFLRQTENPCCKVPMPLHIDIILGAGCRKG